MAKYVRDAEEEAMREYHIKQVENPFEKVQATRIIDGEEVVCNYRKQPLEAGFVINYYAPFEPGTHLLEGGIIYERDVAVEMRDGRKLYCDIYRPKDQTDIPVIVAWSPFGKRHWHGRGIAPGLQTAMGVPKGAISDMAAFEAPDPGFWCHQGYAVVNVDVGGVGYSEGDYLGMCARYGEDGYDAIEWLAKQKWCNGNVGMAGNSGLSIGQWFVAASCPPSLKCIAPWEGTADFYRESMFPGGIPYPAFASMIHLSLRGPGLIQDPAEDMKSHPLFDTYWDDLKAKVEKIRIPVYATASYMHSLHLRGAVHSFMNVRSRNKWMRFHRDFEWPDFNNPKYMGDLKLFMDRFLKNIHNGWEMTPRIRMGVTDAYEFDYQVDRPETEYPLERTEYTRFYLDAEQWHSEPVAAGERGQRHRTTPSRAKPTSTSPSTRRPRSPGSPSCACGSKPTATTRWTCSSTCRRWTTTAASSPFPCSARTTRALWASCASPTGNSTWRRARTTCPSTRTRPSRS